MKNCFELDSSKILYFRKKIINYHKEFFPQFPWRLTKNKWHALVAEIMLQRTKAEQVLPVYLYFCEHYGLPKEYLNDKGKNIFKSLGLLWRDKELRKLASIQVEKTPNWLTPYFLIGLTYWNEGKFENAKISLQYVADRTGDDPEYIQAKELLKKIAEMKN